MSENDIPVISLWQPWAQWVALGWKTIETRTHSRFYNLVGRRVAIHASLRWDENWCFAQQWLTKDQIEQTTRNRPHWPRGKIVCIAFAECLRVMYASDEPKALISCDGTRNAMPLTDVQKIEPARSIKGRQGIFYVPETLLA